MQVVFQRSICCPGAHNTQYCCLYFGGTVSHRTPQSMPKESREKKRQRKRQRIRVEETQKATEGAGATDPAGSSGVGQVLMIRLVLDRFNSRLLMACPTGPAEPAAVAESEYSSASSAQTPAAPPSRKRVHSEGAGASDGGKRGSAQHAQASTSNSSEATAAVLVSPPLRKRGHSDSVGTSDEGRALSSPVISIKVVRRSSRSKKTTASPGDHSCGACPVSSLTLALRQEQYHQHKATTEAVTESGNWR